MLASMKGRAAIAIAVAGIVTSTTICTGFSEAFASQGNLTTVAEITAARKANARLMHEYTWNCRTELIDAGQVKDNRLDLVQYGPDGKLKRTLLNDQSAPLPFGFLRRAVAENEKADLEKYLTALQGLLDQYTLPTEGKVLDFLNQATVTGPNANGLLELTGHSVVVPGDTFTVWADQRTKQTSRIKVQTTYAGDAVSLDATFKALFSGLTYMNFADVTVPAKQLSIQVQNFDYVAIVRAAPTVAPAPPPPPAAAPAPAPAAGKPLPLGIVVPALPAGCITTPVGGVQYFYCGGNFYRASIQGNSLVYVTVQP